MKKILLFTKQNQWCNVVGEFCKRNFETTWVRDNFKGQVYENYYDYVISYLSPIILPKRVLDMAKIAAINFHPGPPKYPGIGGYNFALYNGDETYGCIVHEMVEKVDSGPILSWIQFPLHLNDTVESLKEKSMGILLTMFYRTMDHILLKGKPERINMEWEREPYTRKDLQYHCNMGNFVDIHENDDINGFDLDKWYNAFYFPGAKDKPFYQDDKYKYYIIREDHEKTNFGGINYT